MTSHLAGKNMLFPHSSINFVRVDDIWTVDSYSMDAWPMQALTMTPLLQRTILGVAQKGFLDQLYTRVASCSGVGYIGFHKGGDQIFSGQECFHKKNQS